MSVAQSGLARKHHRVFRTVKAGDVVRPTPLALDEHKDVLGDVLSTETLKALAAEHGALDQRERTVTASVFFWAMVLSQAPGQVVSLGSVVTQLTLAALLVGRDGQGRVQSQDDQRQSDGAALAVLPGGLRLPAADLSGVAGATCGSHLPGLAQADGGAGRDRDPRRQSLDPDLPRHSDGQAGALGGLEGACGLVGLSGHSRGGEPHAPESA